MADLEVPDFIPQKKHDLADWTYYIYIVYINMYIYIYIYTFTRDILIHSMHYTHTHKMEYYSASKKETLLFQTCTNLEDINHE